MAGIQIPFAFVSVAAFAGDEEDDGLAWDISMGSVGRGAKTMRRTHGV